MNHQNCPNCKIDLLINKGTDETFLTLNTIPEDMRNCGWCTGPFRQTRGDQRFCSPSCSVSFHNKERTIRRRQAKNGFYQPTQPSNSPFNAEQFDAEMRKIQESQRSKPPISEATKERMKWMQDGAEIPRD